MTIVTLIIISLAVLLVTFVVGEWLVAGRPLPSRRKRKDRPHDSLSQDR